MLNSIMVHFLFTMLEWLPPSSRKKLITVKEIEYEIVKFKKITFRGPRGLGNEMYMDLFVKH